MYKTAQTFSINKKQKAYASLLVTAGSEVPYGLNNLRWIGINACWTGAFDDHQLTTKSPSLLSFTHLGLEWSSTLAPCISSGKS